MWVYAANHIQPSFLIHGQLKEVISCQWVSHVWLGSWSSIFTTCCHRSTTGRQMNYTPPPPPPRNNKKRRFEPLASAALGHTPSSWVNVCVCVLVHIPLWGQIYDSNLETKDSSSCSNTAATFMFILRWGTEVATYIQTWTWGKESLWILLLSKTQKPVRAHQPDSTTDYRTRSAKKLHSGNQVSLCSKGHESCSGPP